MMRFRSTLAVLVAGVLLSPFALASEPVAGTDGESISFAREIRPLLSDKCFACHGPDEQTREADLRLDVREDAVESGAIVAGSPDESELVRRILLSADDDERMPPASFHKELSPKDVKLMQRWIASGAPYEQHWSYRPLKRPPVPNVSEQAAGESGNPIDSFISAALSQNGLESAPAADPNALIRRLYLDLVGMPPTTDEAQAYLSAPSHAAFENAVDELLRDPRFGERMAVYWLDLVRYADTIGYHSDTHMEISAYRDYVIRSFNQNKPFHQFTVEQLAGDLLPDPTEEQLIASGYNRLLQTTEEGGAQAKEYIAIYAADRVRNVSGVWMGQTVGCAQCHDHKYDPITMKDFYSLAAFFADIEENAVGKRKPNFTLPTPEQTVELERLKKRLEELRVSAQPDANKQLADAIREEQEAWEKKTLATIDAGASPWEITQPTSASATGGAKLQRQSDGSFLATGKNPDVGTYSYALKSDAPVAAIRLEVFPDPSFPKKDGFSRSNGNFVLTEVKVFRGDESIPISSADADYQQNSWPIAHAIDAKQKTGWAIDGHHKKAKKRSAIFRIGDGVSQESTGDPWRIELHHNSSHAGHLIGRFRISVTDQASASFDDAITIPEAVKSSLRVAATERDPDQVEEIAQHYRSLSPALAKAKQDLAAAEEQWKSFQSSLRTTLIATSAAKPRMTRILSRGNWLDDSGAIVEPAVPEFLPHEPIEGRRATRLDLANWLVADTNPLTSRTFVNRLWKLFHGRGLSRNLDDLGGQGEAPSHPELLDWLAAEFRDSGWDVKQLVRLMLTSSTYQQSSVASPTAQSKDPLNQYFARQGRWRLEAEFVRDTALSISNLLATETIGGQSVKPYQPAGYWQHLNFPKRTWQADTGANLYRRGLYTFWCRTFLHPSMLAFDAPSREECTAERARSNIPQQALVLLNDPVFVEASRSFAQRMIDSSSETDERISWGIRTAMTRPAAESEIQLLKSLYEDQRSRFAESPQDATELLQVGSSGISSEKDAVELAAWTQVARAILNAYETTSRF